MNMKKNPLRFRFPDNRTRALIMSYDDGSEHDRRLVEIFNEFKIRGTFNLNSGKLDEEGHLRTDEIRDLFRYHEVASHSLTHSHLNELDSDDMEQEILEDRVNLERITHRPVRGLAYPYGAYHSGMIPLLSQLGIDYARTATPSYNFDIPSNVYIWPPTCHHNQARQFSETFLKEESDKLQIQIIFGHSYQLDGFMTEETDKNWDFMHDYCKWISVHDEIWFITHLELYDYIAACRSVKFNPSKNILINFADIPVYGMIGSEFVELDPGMTIKL